MRRCVVLVGLLVLAGCNKVPEKNELAMANASVADVQKAAEKVETITPGLWTVATTISDVRLPAVEDTDPKMAGAMVRQMLGRTQTQTMCVTPEQARGPSSQLIGGSASGDCSFETFSLLRGTLNAVMTCRKQGEAGQLVVATNGAYAGDTVELESVMRVEETLDQPKEKALRFIAKVAGKRTGECPATKEGRK